MVGVGKGHTHYSHTFSFSYNEHLVRIWLDTEGQGFSDLGWASSFMIWFVISVCVLKSEKIVIYIIVESI